MAESKEELKSLLMKVKEENEQAGLKLKIQKTKITASSSITSHQIDGETAEIIPTALKSRRFGCLHFAQSSGLANLCPLEDKSKESWRLHLLLFTYLSQDHEGRNVNQYISTGYRHFLYLLCMLPIEKHYNLQSNGLALYYVMWGKLFKVCEPQCLLCEMGQ